MLFEEEISRITRAQFGIEPSMFADIETIYRADDPIMFDQMRSGFEAGLSAHSDPDGVLRKCFVGPDFAVFLLAAYPNDELQSIRPESRLYYPVCTYDEIRRIESPASAADILLKLRADEIAENVRLHRVFLRRRERTGSSWALSTHFSNGAFESYVSNLPDEKRQICESVAAGTAFLLQPNGICISTPWGTVVVVSESLEHYLYYMNFFLMTLDSKITSEEDASQALYIAIRTMMRTETPDFDLDPRGMAPEPLNERILSVVGAQIAFIVGHEYAHIIGGHIKNIRMAVPEMASMKSKDRPKIYSPAQEQEFAADLGSMLNPEWSKEQLFPYVAAAHWFFYGLDLLEEVTEYLEPNRRPGQHPSARDRLRHLRAELVGRELFDEEKCGDDAALAHTFVRLDGVKQSLRNILPKATDRLKVYGSQYLPSHRPGRLLDRIHY